MTVFWFLFIILIVFISFLMIYLVFPFSALLTYWGLPTQCWVEAIRMSIFVFSQSLGAVFHYVTNQCLLLHLWCSVSDFKSFLLFLVCQVGFFQHEWMLNFNSFFSVFIKMIISFPPLLMWWIASMCFSIDCFFLLVMGQNCYSLHA